MECQTKAWGVPSQKDFALITRHSSILPTCAELYCSWCGLDQARALMVAASKQSFTKRCGTAAWHAFKQPWLIASIYFGSFHIGHAYQYVRNEVITHTVPKYPQRCYGVHIHQSRLPRTKQAPLIVYLAVIGRHSQCCNLLAASIKGRRKQEQVIQHETVI